MTRSAVGEVTASLEAERLESGSELDSVMYIYSPNDGRLGSDNPYELTVVLP